MAIRLGELLLREKRITPAQLQEALTHQRANGGRLGRTLVKLGFLRDEDITTLLSKQYGVPAITLSQFDLDPAVVRLIPVESAAKYNVIPVGRTSTTLTLAMTDPTNVFAMDDIKFMTGLHVEPVVASENAIREAIERYYGGKGAPTVNGAKPSDLVTKALEDLSADSHEDLEVLAEAAGDRRGGAREAGRRSAHHPARQRPVAVGHPARRERHPHRAVREGDADPAAHRRRAAARHDAAAQISRSHHLAREDHGAARHRREAPAAGRPHQGRGSTTGTSPAKSTSASRVCRRSSARRSSSVCSIPTSLRLDMTRLGLDTGALAKLDAAIRRPWGMVLVTGPTGSGKTNTLYSALTQLNQPGVNIMTAEDPVEFNLVGVNQVQVRESIGLTFAHVLRSFLRQDPNVILVGEIRDTETASIAVKAALTGHMVLSTLHTNDAPSTVNRLVNMGIEPFLVASSVNLVCAQRLVRRICEQCRRAAPHVRRTCSWRAGWIRPRPSRSRPRTAAAASAATAPATGPRRPVRSAWR